MQAIGRTGGGLYDGLLARGMRPQRHVADPL